MKYIKKVLSLLIASVLLITPLFSIPVSAKSLPEVAALGREAAAEGIVMLKNEQETLPLKTGEVTSVFGRVQCDSFYCGFGSGGGVQKPYLISILAGLEANEGITLNTELATKYKNWCAENPPNLGTWANWPYHFDEMPITAEEVSAAAAVSDKALVVIGRSSGEDRDAKAEKGSYYLTDDELALLEKVNSSFSKIAVLLNVGSVIDMSWVSQYSNITSVVYVWQGGQDAGNAIADVLSGDKSPSGKLVDTIAASYEDYPSSANFGNSAYCNYVEDIFVGYRYFETFAKDKVVYPFGYGLSYTDFSITSDVKVEGDKITVTATVKNTGSVYSGKEVVQVYYSAPQGQLGKPKLQLANYIKTNEIAPGDSQTVTMSFTADKMASYDDSGATGNKSAWVLEAGEYGIYVGNSVRNVEKKGTYNLSSLKVVEQLEEASAVASESVAFDRMTAKEAADGTVTLSYDRVPVASSEADLPTRVLNNLPSAVAITGDQGIKLIDVYNGTRTMDEFVAQLSAEELADISRGDYTKGSSLGPAGNASVFGGVSEALRNKGISAVSTCDGPSGIGAACEATLLPIGTMLACTWNNELVERLYGTVAKEMNAEGFDALLGPGMNIHRNPICGRNFEYFSEDPLLTGMMGSSVVKGLQNNGSSAVPKHFAVNSQEYNRYKNDSRVSERAQREIYLRGFEIVVKTAKPHYIMGSYNKINGEWSHYNYDLCTQILRKDWGFEGTLMTDWWLQEDTSSELGNVKNNAYRVRAQMDLNMPGEGPGDNTSNERTILNAYDSWVAAGSPTDRLVGITLGEMQRTAKNVLNAVMTSSAFRLENGLSNTYTEGDDWFVNEGTQWVESPELEYLAIDGMPRFNAFNPSQKIYKVYLNDMTVIPTVTAAADGASVTVEQATAESPSAVITVVKNGAKCTYRVIFTNEAGVEPVVSKPKYAKVTGIKVNGEYIPEFYPETYEYTVKGLAASTIFELDTAEGVSYTVDRRSDNSAFIRASTEDQAAEYTIKFIEPVVEATIASDDFNTNTLDTNTWSVLNQNSNLSVSNGQVNITTQSSEWEGTGSGKNNIRNVVYQSGVGNWSAEVKVTITNPGAMVYKNSYQVGLAVFDDPDNYADVMYGTASWHGLGQFFRVRKETNGVCKEADYDQGQEWHKNNIANAEGWKSLSSVSFWLKVEKNGSNYIFSVKTPGYTDFKVYGTVTAYFNAPKVGFYASNGNGDAASTTVSFDDFSVTKEATIESDEFEDGAINQMWGVLNKDEASLSESNGALKININATGSWDGGRGDLKNVVYQSANGNWTATTKITLTGDLRWKDAMIGMMVFDDTNNYLSFNYVSPTWNGNGQLFWIYNETAGTNSNVSPTTCDWHFYNLIASEAWHTKTSATFYLKVVKKDNNYTLSVNTADRVARGEGYLEFVTVTKDFSAPKIGLFASRTSDTGLTTSVSFDDFSITDFEMPAEPEKVIPDPVSIASDAETKVMAADSATYMSPGMKTTVCTDETAAGTNIEKGTNGQYSLYPINVQRSGWYNLSTRYACENSIEGVQLNHNIELDGDRIASFSPASTGGWQAWRTTTANLVYLPAGRHTLKFNFVEEMSLNYLLVSPTEAKTVNLSESKNGAVTVSKQATVSGDTVKLIPQASRGFALKSITVTKADDSSVSVSVASDYTFVMPDYEVTVNAEFYPNGDVNSDGKTNVLDIISTKKILVKSYVPLDAPDLNEDNSFGSGDLVWLRRYILSK